MKRLMMLVLFALILAGALFPTPTAAGELQPTALFLSAPILSAPLCLVAGGVVPSDGGEEAIWPFPTPDSELYCCEDCETTLNNCDTRCRRQANLGYVTNLQECYDTCREQCYTCASTCSPGCGGPTQVCVQ